MNIYIHEPKIYTFEAIVAELAEIFQQFTPDSYLKSENQELFEAMADKEFLEDWLINSLDENIDEIIAGFRDSVKDKSADEQIQCYLKMLSEMRIKTDLYAIIFVEENSKQGYVREKLKTNEEIQNIQNHIDWEGLADEEFEEWETLELKYPEINFKGTWYYR